jgi:uncharacterized protein with HEPN domain
MSRLADALEHMQRAIDKILRFAPTDRQAFDSDEMRRDSIERNLITLADAATRVPREIQDTHPEIPWRQIIGMRNVLTHDYKEVDPDIVWNVVVNERPALRDAIAALRASAFGA